MRHRTKLLAGSAVAVALLAGALFSGVLAGVSRSRLAGRRHLAGGLGERTLRDLPQGGTEATIARLETALAPAPNNQDALATLGLAYQMRWRETGDSGYLPRSNAALRKALAASPHDPTATLGLGNLALIRHQFRDALVVGREARARAVFGAALRRVGDAQIELGRYPAAFADASSAWSR